MHLFRSQFLNLLQIPALMLLLFKNFQGCIVVYLSKIKPTLPRRSEICFAHFKPILSHRSVITNLRRRRDLNPRAAINDLHPFQGCPFNHLGTSPKSCLRKRIQFSPTLENNSNGEGGIRTHAPLRTNGFQDRLVMTTSILLRIHLFALSY